MEHKEGFSSRMDYAHDFQPQNKDFGHSKGMFGNINESKPVTRRQQKPRPQKYQAHPLHEEEEEKTPMGHQFQRKKAKFAKKPQHQNLAAPEKQKFNNWKQQPLLRPQSNNQDGMRLYADERFEDRKQTVHQETRPSRGTYSRGRGAESRGGRIARQSQHDQDSRKGDRFSKNDKPSMPSRFFSQACLQSLNDLDFKDLLDRLCGFKSISDSINSTKFSYKGYSLLIELALKLIRGPESLVKNGMVAAFFDSHFFRMLESDFLRDIIHQTKKHEFAFRVNDLTNMVEVMDACSDLFRTRVNELPIVNLKAFIVDGDLGIMQHLYDKAGANSAKVQVLNDRITRLSEKRKELIVNKIHEKAIRAEESKQRKTVVVDQSYKLKPPFNFQEINVIPDSRELLAQQAPFLRKIPEKGSFRDPHDYLDCIFRLLHEDAARPLREGLQCILMKQRQPTFNKQLQQMIKQAGVFLYEDVTMTKLNLSLDNKVLTILFNLPNKGLKSINWQSAKRLLPGSLVLLSHDGFKTIFWGLVRARDGVQMNLTAKKFHFVEVDIEIVKSNVTNMQSIVVLYENFKHYSLTMVESAAYFEAYFHILNKLKTMDNNWTEIPFMDELALIQREQQKPVWMLESLANYSIKRKIQLGTIQAKLDSSQQEALERCLFNRLAIVQGPPGTGKTYVGQQFVKILLSIKDSWLSRGPILLVCYTNHALDQFLNLIRGYTDKFVRVGGRCSDESLKAHSLIEYCMNNNVKRSRQFYMFKDIMSSLKNQFSKTQNRMRLYEVGVVHGFLNDQAATNLLYELKQQFPAYLRQIRNSIFNAEEYDLLKEILDELNERIKQNPKQIIVFWLGIVDLPAYIEQEKQARLATQTDQSKNDNDNDVVLQDYDERQLDYMKDAHAPNVNEIEEQGIDQTYSYLTSWYSPDTTLKQFRSAKTFKECVLIGQNFKKQSDQPKTLKGLFNLPLEKRWQINNALINYSSEDQEKDAHELNMLAADFKRAAEEQKSLDNETKAQIFRQVDIVAMTTTGCAKNSDLLKDTTFPIVIVEEAAEVFEAHILTSLSKKTEHLVLIGDHQQLKPNPAIFELEKKFNLNMSMFERLVNNEFGYSMLKNQRRMRPEISSIMRLLYPALKDDISVTKYPHIRGLDKDVFFFDHQQYEDAQDAMSSKLNDFEAVMILKFSTYLLQQSYKPEKITVLSLYQAQTVRIQKYLRGQDKKSPLGSIKVSTVDNYQGEENDIIILSLVRSNAANNIGYLKISNRVCVALSRAKHGMFIFGNSQCLLNFQRGAQQQNKLWQDVIAQLKEKDLFGPELTLKCQEHSNQTKIRVVKDFQNVPEGGCKLMCNSRLGCGHKCESFCHPYLITEDDKTGHNNYKCFKTCTREQKCNHPCRQTCYKCVKGCLPCSELVPITMNPCGHEIKVKCCNSTKVNICTAKCEKIHPCGHQCQKDCFENCQSGDYKCKEYVNKQLPCGHSDEVDCYKDPLQHLLKNGCHKPCQALLECGHQCPSTCGECFNNIFHGVCKQKCERPLFCGHLCKESCTSQCPSCNQKCATQCVHSKCQRRCKDVCDQCKEVCDNWCKHSACTRLCFQPCDRKPCSQPCDLKLECGHPCIGVCGDKCIQICRVCKPNHETFDILFGKEEENDSRFVELDCGHAIEVTAMDTWMQQDSQKGIIQFKRCPKCNSQIKTCGRYKSITNAVFNDINSVKKRVAESEKQLLKQWQEIFKLYCETQQETSKSYEIGAVNMNKLEKVFKEFQTNLEKNKSNAEEVKRLFQKLELIRVYVQLLRFIYMYETKQLGASATELLLNKAKRATKHMEFFKFILSKEQASSAKELAKYLSEKFGNKDFKEMIVKAIGLGKGRWFKCKNGHFYAIGECGGATETSKCPECGEIIGGNNHNLAQGNQHAGEFDGSRNPAWDQNGFDQQMLNGQINLDQFN